MKNSNEKKRIRWVDIAKGLGIVLVIFGHTYRNNPPLIWLYSFHMPLFFFISGWLAKDNLLKEGKNQAYIFKKFLTLIIPYLLFSLLNYVYWIVIEIHFRNYNQGPIWFLVSLFVVEIIVKVFLKNKKNKTTAVTKLSLYMGLTLLVYANLNVEFGPIGGWSIRVVNGLFWYTLGYLAHIYLGEYFSKDTNTKFFFVNIVVLLAVSWIVSQLNGRVDMYSNRFQNEYLYILGGLFGIGFCVLLSLLIKKSNILEYLGKYSIIILGTHEPIKRIVIQVFGLLLKKETEVVRNNVYLGGVIVIVVLLVELGVIMCFRTVKDRLATDKLSWLFMYIK